MTHWFTSDVRLFLSNDFMTAVSLSQIATVYDNGTADVYAVRCLANESSQDARTLAQRHSYKSIARKPLDIPLNCLTTFERRARP